MNATKKSPKTAKTCVTKPAPMVPLATTDVPIIPPSTTPSKDTEVLSMTISGTIVKDYNKQAKDKAAAEAEMKKLRPSIEADALRCLLEHNLAHKDTPVTTVRVRDNDGNEGAAIIDVSNKDSYKDLDYSQAVAALGAAGVTNPNLYMQEHVVVGFSTDSFYDANGKLDQDYYKAMLEAIQACAEANGKPMPMSSAKVYRVLPTFHQNRWNIGQDRRSLPEKVCVQQAISKTFQNTVSLTPRAK